MGAIKKDIPNANPFVGEFEYGALNDCYWNYEHMVLQLKDLKYMYPKYDFLFLFDHSCGHNKQREDGLNIENMSKSYGGKQKSLCWPILIKEECRYLIKLCKCTMKPSDMQYMVFQIGDEGPF